MNIRKYISSKYQQSKQWILHIVMRMFWNGLMAKLTLITTIEVLAHLSLRISFNDFSFPVMLHLITWSIGLLVCVVLRLFKIKSYA